MRTTVYHSIISILYNTPTISIGLQTIVFKKDTAIQCSLLPAPQLLFDGTLDARPEVNTDLEMDEVTTLLEDSDTDYMTDATDTIEM